jgi:enoyl-CoA hydratase/carnithine racemase
MQDVTSAAVALDDDPAVKAVVLTGAGSKAFAAGADIREMSELSYTQVWRTCWQYTPTSRNTAMTRKWCHPAAACLLALPAAPSCC